MLPVPPIMHPWSVESAGLTFSKFGNAMTDAASAVWPTANLALFIPFHLSLPAIAQKMLCHNGAAVSGNIDVGIYDPAGTRLVSIGSTAQAGTGAIQEFDIADTLIGPGLFYMAIVLDNITGTLLRGASAGTSSGSYKQTSAFALPATATFATYDISSYIPVFGIAFNKTLI